MFKNTKSSLRLIQFNVENLFLYMDFYQNEDLKSMTEDQWRKISGSSTPNKPLKKVWDLAACLEDIDPDIVCLNEVGGEESLQNFNRHFLGEKYNVHIKEGNSLRGIDVGYLVRKDLDYKSVLLSHKNRPINFLYPQEDKTPAGGKSHYFSRDVLELRLFHPDENSPRLVLLLTHLKSKLDADKVDFEGRRRREAELKTLVRIYNEVREELGHAIPMFVIGDLNGQARKIDHEPEFQSLHEDSDLVDALEALNIPLNQRVSQVQIQPSGTVTPLQIDYIFVSPEFTSQLIPKGSGTYFYKSPLKTEIGLPNSMAERDLLPSDHYPLILNFSLPHQKAQG